MASKFYGTLYTGVTATPPKRFYDHRHGLMEGFSKRYGCKYLVYYEMHATMEAAIEREKKLKGSSRKRKIALIESMNPQWRDLYGTTA
jgi:putative endonuclease